MKLCREVALNYRGDLRDTAADSCRDFLDVMDAPMFCTGKQIQKNQSYIQEIIRII
jgi:hypothetical protein